jgi:hypothetical protein
MLTSYFSVLFTPSFVFVVCLLISSRAAQPTSRHVTSRHVPCTALFRRMQRTAWTIPFMSGVVSLFHPYALMDWARTVLHFLKFAVCNCHFSTCNKFLRCNLEVSRRRHVLWSLTRNLDIIQTACLCISRHV